MGRAEWRIRADDPTSLVGWWWRSVGESRRALLATLPFVVCAVVGCVGGGWGWLVLAAANLAFVMGRPLKADDRLALLLPDPPPPGQFLAAVAYGREGLRTGADAMALTVVEGWLYAEGVRSHFALRREDVRDLSTGSDQRGWLALRDGSEIRLKGIDDAARITLERWWQAKALGGGEPTLPPARVHSQEFARAGLSLAIGAFLSGVGAFIPHGGWLSFGVRQGSWLVGLVLSIASARTLWNLIKIDVREQIRRSRENHQSAVDSTPPLLAEAKRTEERPLAVDS